ncbi:MAG: FtsQ-type POTRA domain-containing protein [Clostridiaceae bacterium]|nr:FtsQ-type POTRA domain-containing protein [Clostridiaceae bacterium]
MRKNNRGFTVLISILLIILGLAAVIIFSPLFLLSQITVDEISKYTKEDIIRVSGIEKGQNALKYVGGSIEHLLQMRMGKAEKYVENLPWVKSAVIQYKFSGVVHISVIERNAIAWIKYMGNYLLVDEEGVVLEVSTELDERYPEIRGLKPDKYTIGKIIEIEKPERITWLVQLLRSLEHVDRDSPQSLVAALDWIDFSENDELYMSLDGRIAARVNLDSELTYRLSLLKEIYYNHIKKEEKGMVDFFGDKYARFIPE